MRCGGGEGMGGLVGAYKAGVTFNLDIVLRLMFRISQSNSLNAESCSDMCVTK